MQFSTLFVTFVLAVASVVAIPAASNGDLMLVLFVVKEY